ncbi:ribonuclease D [Biformimicrobium ophioploci]|uniref:Ribonuclease D n=1 Tax=Biformimicrobium ophioploci TaxID=3036711 RepID=A0ABQ6LYX1_9GAMM|nr:ribonuclease D [Microbulbifer sp. NKW57]GMG87284.1 ribonuclease D [Microbulbifer sp. NKW57]
MSENVIDTTPRWVDSGEELARLCESWSSQAAIAVDTEFMRSRTFFPIPALVQVSDGRHCYLIDNLAIEDLSPLKALLTNPEVIKIFHACSEDLETFVCLLGSCPTPIVDTQIMAAMCGHGSSLGYANLVKATLNIELPKSETRSDWLQRPLSDAQKKYAALDVAYLPVIYGLLKARLRELEREDWLAQDCTALVAAFDHEEPPQNYYVKVKGAWQLSREQLSVLREICAWREIEARKRDLPRNRLVRENVCLDIARKLPQSRGALAALGVEGRSLRIDGETILDLVEKGRNSESLPPLLSKPLNRYQGETLKLLREEVRRIAEALDMPPELLIRKKELEELVLSRKQVLDGRLRGWRGHVLGEELLEILEERKR